MIRTHVLCLALCASAFSQQGPAASEVCKSCLRSEVEYLAGDSLRGRGSGTDDELTAAKHVASIFRNLGLEAVGGEYVHAVTLERMNFIAPPQVKFKSNGKEITLTHGKEILANRLNAAEIKGKLFHAKADPSGAAEVPAGSVVLIEIPEAAHKAPQKIYAAFLASKASIVLINAMPDWVKDWDKYAVEEPSMPPSIPGEKPNRRASLIALKPEPMALLLKAPDGTEITIGAPAKPDPLNTRNVVGLLRGSDPKLKDEYVMFSAHMDHLGVRGNGDDTIFNGADDDASGTSTVLELARIFSKGERPKRSVLFVTYGSEELGLLGSRAFAANPVVPLNSIVADIEFEQTGLPQEKMDSHFWMTGSQLSDLRSELEKHGSVIGDDPYPGNPFFRASDNYSLASKGVVAHTVSGAAEFPDYHQPGDEARKLDYDFMSKALEQALPGFRWLVNSEAKPSYLPGKNPAEK